MHSLRGPGIRRRVRHGAGPLFRQQCQTGYRLAGFTTAGGRSPPGLLFNLRHLRRAGANPNLGKSPTTADQSLRLVQVVYGTHHGEL